MADIEIISVSCFCFPELVFLALELHLQNRQEIEPPCTNRDTQLLMYHLMV